MRRWRKTIRRAGFLLFPLLGIACRTITYQSPSLDRPLILASTPEEQSCRKIGSDSNWYLLFGLVPLTDPDIDSFLEPGKTYRITRRVSPLDAAVTLGGGFLISLTRDTTDVEVCDDSGYLVLDPLQEKKRSLRDLEEGLYRHMVELSRNRDVGELPVIYMKNGESYQGRIASATRQEIVLELPVLRKDQEKLLKSADDPESRQSAGSNLTPLEEAKDGIGDPGDSREEEWVRVMFQSGEVVLGRLLSEDEEKLLLEREGETLEIPRKEILSQSRMEIQNPDPAEDLQVARWERIRIRQNEIESISLQGDLKSSGGLP